MINTTLLMPAEIADQWHILKGYVGSALAHGVNETSIEEWLRRLLSFQAQLWVVKEEGVGIKAVCITQFINYDTHRTIHIVTLSGEDYGMWADQLKVIEEFGKKHQCVAVEQWGRPGWSRMIPKYIPEFKTVYHVMRKEIT